VEQEVEIGTIEPKIRAKPNWFDGNMLGDQVDQHV